MERTRNRAFIITSVILTMILTIGRSVQASPVVLSELTQVLSSQQKLVDLRLRTLEHESSGPSVDPMNPGSGIMGSALAIEGQEQKPVVISVDQGDVQGTICDCGEIVPTAGAGFPKWSLLFLVGLPLLLISHGGSASIIPTESSPVITPPSVAPPVPEIPEPVSLLLFGSGLLALGTELRRRAKIRLMSRNGGNNDV